MKEQLIIDDMSSIPKRFHRVLSINPSIFYERAETLSFFSYYKRYNTVFSDTIFPQEDKSICACGCKRKLSGRRKRWATDDCKDFSNYVISILMGRVDTIRMIMSYLYGGYKCIKCNRSDDDFEAKPYPIRAEYDDIDKYLKDYNKWMYDVSSKIHLDHIIPVHQGGGACWLSNYQFLCIDCHKEKSKKEKYSLKELTKEEIQQNRCSAYNYLIP